MGKQSQILEFIREKGEADAYEIAEAVGCTSSYVGKMLRPLAETGQIVLSAKGRKRFFKLNGEIKIEARSSKSKKPKIVPPPSDDDAPKHWAVGQLLNFPFCPERRKGRCGWYTGVIQSVTVQGEEITSVTVRLYDDSEHRLVKEEFAANYAAVIHNGSKVRTRLNGEVIPEFSPADSGAGESDARRNPVDDLPVGNPDAEDSGAEELDNDGPLQEG